MGFFKRKELYYAIIEFSKEHSYVDVYPYYNGMELSPEEMPDFLIHSIRECLISLEKYRGVSDIDVLIMKKSAVH